MAGIGDRMSGENSIVRRADGTIRDDIPGSPPPDAATLRRLEKRAKAWARWEAGEDVSNDELFGPMPEDAV